MKEVKTVMAFMFILLSGKYYILYHNLHLNKILHNLNVDQSCHQVFLNINPTLLSNRGIGSSKTYIKYEIKSRKEVKSILLKI